MSGRRKDEEFLSCFFVKKKMGMILCNFQKEPSSVFNDSCSDAKKMKSQGFKSNGPPGWRQGFSFHDGQDVVGEQIEPPPSRIGKESFSGHDPSSQVIFEDIVDLLHGSASLSLPPQQSLPVPTPYVRNHSKVVIGISIPKEFSLGRPNTDGQIPIRFHSLFSRRLARNKFYFCPLLSPNDQTFIGHLSQRLPSLFRKSLNRCSQLLCHIGADGKLNPGSSRHFFRHQSSNS